MASSACGENDEGGRTMRFTVRQVAGVPGQMRYAMTRAGEDVALLGASPRTIPGSVIYEVACGGESWQLRIPASTSRVPDDVAGTRPVVVMGDAEPGKAAPLWWLTCREERSGLLVASGFYQLLVGGRTYRAYPSDRVRGECRLPVLEVVATPAGEEATQVALARCRANATRTPKGYSVAAGDLRSAVAALILVCYDCHLALVAESGATIDDEDARLPVRGGRRAQRLDDLGFEHRAGQ